MKVNQYFVLKPSKSLSLIFNLFIFTFLQCLGQRSTRSTTARPSPAMTMKAKVKFKDPAWQKGPWLPSRIMISLMIKSGIRNKNGWWGWPRWAQQTQLSSSRRPQRWLRRRRSLRSKVRPQHHHRRLRQIPQAQWCLEWPGGQSLPQQQHLLWSQNQTRKGLAFVECQRPQGENVRSN